MTVGRVRPKHFIYRTSVAWNGEGGGTLRSEGKPDLDFAPPADFQGPGDIWSPEEMQVGAVETCVLLSFLYYARRAGIELQEYFSEAEGRLELVGHAISFTGFTLRPRIVVTDADQLEATRKTLEKAEAACFITRSLSEDIQIRLEADISAAD